ncbi:uncharacterized protein LOC129921628 [Biomphalaria glabrata]|uniref:Uncharacterized protein LOC129921628 n=1 Tax=Biomphalaria glabrata TaxID=6526 RepID=A0A9W2Y9U5_BIOGL|nr:uncharacterized protein LOC129921628 [Biomphalaria glabrata]
MAHEDISRQLKTEDKNVTDLQKEASLSSLPVETLEQIFMFLSKEDLLQAMSVCTSWKSVIVSSPNLWKKQTFVLDCTLRTTKKIKTDLLFCFQNFGPHCQTLSVKCRHPCLHDCQKMANRFNLFLTFLVMPRVTSFKVSNLRMECAKGLVMKSIANKLTKMFARHPPLNAFEMSSAHWTIPEGQKVLDAVFKKSRNTLETLRMEEYFVYPSRRQKDLDWLSTGLTSLTKLTKLCINFFYLTDEIIVSLASSRRGELTCLSLLLKAVSPQISRIQQASWIYLAEACPDVEVEFNIMGNVYKPSVSLPALLDPVLPVCRLKMIISKILFYSTRRHGYKMAIVFDHIRDHYGQSIRSFKLSLPEHKENFDQSLIKLVQSCPRLVHVKVSASFHSQKTAKRIEQIVAERLELAPTSNGRYNKKVCTDSNGVGKASQLEDTMEGPSGFQGASQQ